MKLLLIGDRGAGKTTIGEMIQHRTGMIPHDSSQFALKHVIFPALKDQYDYQTPQQCYDDRHNHRQEWFDLIVEYNDPPDRLAREILAAGDIYVGMRSRREFEHARYLFDVVAWIDAQGRVTSEDRTSMELAPQDSDYIINNQGSIDQLPTEIDGFVIWLNSRYY